MANPVVDIITAIFKPLSDVVDHVLTSGDARVAIQSKIIEGQIAAGAALMNYEEKFLHVQIAMITA